jgi:enediyne biosynthesis protein E4
MTAFSNVAFSRRESALREVLLRAMGYESIPSPASLFLRPYSVLSIAMLLARNNPHCLCLFSLCLWLPLLLSGCQSEKIAPSPAQFVDVARQAGVARVYSTRVTDGQALTILQTIGHGGAFLDYDNDGNLDILLVDTQLTLYRGDGKGQFSERTQSVGLDRLSGHFLGCAVGDYDNDGYDDLYISGYRSGALLHNENGKRFRDVTRTAGLKPQPWGTSCGFSDLDGDGLLDLFLCNYVEFGPDPSRYPQRCEPMACPPQNYNPEKPVLYHNLGGGRFREETQASGVGAAAGKALALAFADYDDDGDQDIIVANDEMPGDLFENRGNFRFENRGMESGTALGSDGRVHGGMGADWADYDRDGILDAIVTTYTDQPKALYRNTGQGLFQNVSDQNGIGAVTEPYVAFGVKWLDYDNDGWPDLLIANGNVDNKIAVIFPDKTYRQPTQLLRNMGATAQGDGIRFADVSKTAGTALTQPIVGRGLATGDFDNDGRIDALLIEDEGQVMLLHNEDKNEDKTGGKSGHWLGLSLVGTGKSNRNALGARVTLTYAGGKQVREVQTASSYLSASDRRLHFGLGTADRIQEVTVRWPDGRIETHTGLAIDRYHTLRQGK